MEHHDKLFLTTVARGRISALSDGPMPARPSTWSCHVCGWHALRAADDAAVAATCRDRLVCLVCGAHQVTDP